MEQAPKVIPVEENKQTMVVPGGAKPSGLNAE